MRSNPNGKKIWYINKSINGKRVVKTLGPYLEISIAQARKTVEELVKEKKDPSNTFGGIYREWIGIKKKSNKVLS